MQDKQQLGKIIRRTVVVGVVLLTLASTLVVGNTLKVILFGPKKTPEPEMIAVVDPGAISAPARSTRSPASIGHSRSQATAYPNGERGSYAPRDEEMPESGGFLESLFGSPQEDSLTAGGIHGGSVEGVSGTPSKAAPDFPQTQNLGVLFSAGGSAAAGSGSTVASSGAGGTNSGGTSDGGAGGESDPAVSPQYANGYTNPNGGIQTVTGGGYYFSASGAVDISGIHGTTPSGRHLWVNESAQISP